MHTKCEQLRARYRMSAVENKHHINDKQVIKCANDQTNTKRHQMNKKAKNGITIDK